MKKIFKLVVSFILSKRKAYIIKRFYRSRKEILDGIKNYVVKSKDVQNIAKYRKLICDECEYKIYDDIYCVIPDLGPCCKLCGCNLELKQYSLSSSCPDGKWEAIIDEEKELLITNFK